SAYRSPEHNRAVGGAMRSKHLDGAAFDIAMTNHDPVAFEAAAREVGFLGFGFYPRSAASRSRSTRGSMTGSGGGGDRRTARRDRRPPVQLGSSALRRHGARHAPVPALAPTLRRARRTRRRTSRSDGENP